MQKAGKTFTFINYILLVVLFAAFFTFLLHCLKRDILYYINFYNPNFCLDRTAKGSLEVLLFLFLFFLSFSYLFRFKPGILKKIELLSVFPAIIIFGIAELFLFIAEPFIGALPDPMMRRSATMQKREIRLSDEANMPGIKREALVTTDEKGFRTTKNIDYKNKGEKTRRIFFVGGSTTEQFYIDDKETTYAILERKLDEFYKKQGLNIEAIGTGKSGAKSVDHYLLIEEIIPLKPDYIVMLVGANDMWASLWSSGSAADDDSLYASRREKIAQNYFSAKGIQYYLSRSRVMRRILYMASMIKARRNDTLIYDDGRQWAEQRKKRISLPVNKLPDSLKAVPPYFEENIDAIIALTKKANIKLLILTQPSLWKKNLSPELDSLIAFWAGNGGGQNSNGGKYGNEDMALVMNNFNKVLKKKADKAGVLDLASLLSKDASVFYDEFHYNNSGAQKIADILFEYFTKNVKL